MIYYILASIELAVQLTIYDSYSYHHSKTKRWHTVMNSTLLTERKEKLNEL
jgi:hypothetical protein